MTGVLRYGDSIYFYNSVEQKEEQHTEQLAVANSIAPRKDTHASKAAVHGFLAAKG